MTQPSTLAQTYSAVGGKPPDVSPAEVIAAGDLSEDEREQVRILIESDGWKVLTKRVWARREYQLLLDIYRAKDDHRFYQGRYAGYKFHEELALQAGRKPERKESPSDRAAAVPRQPYTGGGDA